jgi:hypothetical protein
VQWLPNAEQELAAIWMAAPDRDAVTRAAFSIDQRLQANAPDEGESRSDGVRVLLVAPLGVLFGVVEQTSLVLVAHVWQY